MSVKLFVGFTGTQHGMTSVQLLMLQDLMQHLWIDQFHHGGCIGADAQAHKAYLTSPSRGLVYLHPPVSDAKQAIWSADFVLDRRPYLDRNHDIVDACHLLIAAPQTEQEVLRSGTWATIRYARKQGRAVILLPPSR